MQLAVVVRRTIHMDKRTLFLPDQLFFKSFIAFSVASFLERLSKMHCGSTIFFNTE